MSRDTAKSSTRTERSGPPPDRCELCGRDKPLTFHHLIPRKNHRKARFRRRYEKDEMRHRGLYLCRPCHSGIHDLIPDEAELGERYNTRDQLLAHEGIARHVAWVVKQK
jgi:5-methylcytosine-specific restriction endonuclease McrA